MKNLNAMEIALFVSCCGAASADAGMAQRPIVAFSRLKKCCISNFLWCKDSEAGGSELSRLSNVENVQDLSIGELTGPPAVFQYRIDAAGRNIAKHRMDFGCLQWTACRVGPLKGFAATDDGLLIFRQP